MNSRSLPVFAALFAFVLLALGFAVGYGFHTEQSEPQAVSRLPRPQATPKPEPAKAPKVKGLKASPDNRTLAFSAVFENGTRASRFLLDVKTQKWSATETPRGWQDYTMQWSEDGSKILFDREKIPHSVEDTTAGLYQERVQNAKSAAPKSSGATSLTPKGALPAGEKSYAGFWTPDNSLVVKTRREPKSLFQMGNRARLLDRARGTFLQNRAVRENGKTAFYVVRDAGDKLKKYALFRLDSSNRTRQLTPLQSDVEWCYIAEDARWMVVCRKSDDEENWNWTLWRVTPSRALQVKTARVPLDVIAVFWSPDRKRILGASGKSLWTISIPSLQSRRLGTRQTWNADDATWLGKDAAIVAADGILWKVDVPSGNAQQLWKFPAEYWK